MCEFIVPAHKYLQAYATRSMLSLEARKRRERRNKLAELIGLVTEWAKTELQECFSGIDIDIDNEFYLDDDGSGYVEGVMVNGDGANIYGRLDVFGETAHRVAMAIRIENAESMADLPEGLTDEDDDIRDLARDRLEELGFDELDDKLDGR